MAMGVIECIGDFARESECFVGRQRSLAVEARAERFPFHEGHRVEEKGPSARVDLSGVEDREDVGMLQAGREPDLALESLGADREGDFRKQHLERHGSVVTRFMREVHRRHAATPELALDAVSLAEGRHYLFEHAAPGKEIIVM